MSSLLAPTIINKKDATQEGSLGLKRVWTLLSRSRQKSTNTIMLFKGLYYIEISLDNKIFLEQWLFELRTRRVRIIVPKRKLKAKLINLVKQNAQIELDRLTQGLEKAAFSSSQVMMVKHVAL